LGGKLRLLLISPRRVGPGPGGWLSAGLSDPIDWLGPGSMLFSRSRATLPECSTSANMDSETELLVAGSPIGDNIIGDASLLDYDSNNTVTMHQQEVVQPLVVQPDSDMVTPEAPPEAGNTLVNAPLDAVYCQWASRCSSFRETRQHEHRQHF
jgi:hypothetical protein